MSASIMFTQIISYVLLLEMSGLAMALYVCAQRRHQRERARRAACEGFYGQGLSPPDSPLAQQPASAAEVQGGHSCFVLADRPVSSA
jgi:hypothetical protein